MNLFHIICLDALQEYADFILYICIDTFEQNTIFKKAYMINLYNWRMAIVNMNNNNFKPFIKALKYVKEKNETIEKILSISYAQ